jgi:hypothetical protein
MCYLLRSNVAGQWKTKRDKDERERESLRNIIQLSFTHIPDKIQTKYFCDMLGLNFCLDIHHGDWGFPGFLKSFQINAKKVP